MDQMKVTILGTNIATIKLRSYNKLNSYNKIATDGKTPK